MQDTIFFFFSVKAKSQAREPHRLQPTLPGLPDDLSQAIDLSGPGHPRENLITTSGRHDPNPRRERLRPALQEGLDDVAVVVPFDQRDALSVRSM
jgi:hypothetical protein